MKTKESAMTRRLSLLRLGLVALGAVAFTSIGPVHAGDTAKQQPAQPKVEVVFVVDTTGSMGGLIDAAKTKIWSICNQIATGQPTPQLKVGLVAFRDRGDDYITKLYPLTDDLDAVHSSLMSFKAAGGGDFPESVNQALYEAVHHIQWSKDKGTLRLIFLVGDAPPHMDYKDDVKYPETCEVAVKNDIIINTVQCGKHPETKKYWLDICKRAKGRYVQIDDNGGPIVVYKTPYDDELAEINAKLTKATLVYGTEKQQLAGKAQQQANLSLPPGVAADRAAYYGNAMKGASYDLLENIKNGTVKLEELKKEQLPEELRSLTPAQQKTYLAKLAKTRLELNKKAQQLDKKRSEFIAQEQRKKADIVAQDSFDGQVLMLLQEQASRINVQFAAPAKKK
jgi:Mg-chelatase subunit ChlD